MSLIRAARRLPAALKYAWCNLRAHQAVNFALLAVTVGFYYADVIRDVVLAAQFKAKVVGQSAVTAETIRNSAYPFAIFVAIVASLLLTEAVNFFALLLISRFDGGLPPWKRFLIALAAPLMPGLTAYLEKDLALAEVRLIHGSKEGTETVRGLEESRLEYTFLPTYVHSCSIIGIYVQEVKSARYAWQSLRATLRANENFLEHFLQLTLFIAVFLAETSATRTVQSVGNILVVVDSAYVVVLLLLPVVSLVLGHVNYIVALKRGHLPFVAR